MLEASRVRLRCGSCCPSWTTCLAHPTRRPGPMSPGGSLPTSRAAGRASASRSCATADGSATSLPSCPATTTSRQSCACATRDQPTARPSGSTWPAAASTPNPSCRLPSAPRPAPPKKRSMTPSSSMRAQNPAAYGGPRKCETRVPGKCIYFVLACAHLIFGNSVERLLSIRG
jgi:hypothetical protein